VDVTPTGGLELGDAAQLGSRIARESSVRSFKVQPLDNSEFDSSRVDAFLPQGEFRKSKRDRNIFVEKSAAAINTLGERLEISARGQAARRKSGSPFSFGGKLR